MIKHRLGSRLTLAFWVISVYSQPAQPDHEDTHPIEPAIHVDVTLEGRPPKDYALRFSISNSGSADFAVYRSEVPWLNPNSSIVLGVGTEGVPLRSIARIIDSPRETEIFPRGSTRQGVLRLDERIRELDREIQRRDVIIFWSSRICSTKGTCSKRFGGWVLIPRLK